MHNRHVRDATLNDLGLKLSPGAPPLLGDHPRADNGGDGDKGNGRQDAKPCPDVVEQHDLGDRNDQETEEEPGPYPHAHSVGPIPGEDAANAQQSARYAVPPWIYETFHQLRLSPQI